ncbi:hypothetical protein GOP47_0028423 [Adiantum capillus-veneris]|nr:hypothetical protein GOP47_0028423 [Adiantum capillus-veneris]
MGLVATLVKAAKDLREQIDKLRQNPKHRSRLLILANNLIDMLQLITQVSHNDFELTLNELQCAHQSLEAIAARHRHGLCKSLKSFLTSSTQRNELKEVESKLQHLSTQVLLFRAVPTLCTHNVELPYEVGLDRAKIVLDFLQTRKPQDFRVIGIHGQPRVGLPLALNVVGKLFVDKARHKREEWQRVQDHLATFDGDDEDTNVVRKALELSYPMLKESRQTTLLDMVSTFYGWPWEIAGTIVGVDIMQDLWNSSLISHVNSPNMCSRSAKRLGCLSLLSTTHLCYAKFVTMHDLILRFEESLLRANSTKFSSDANCTKCFIDREQPYDEGFIQFLGSATNLQVLFLDYNVIGQVLPYSKPVLQSSHRNANTSQSRVQNLRYLILRRCHFSEPIIRMKVSQEIRGIILDSCDGFESPPANIHLRDLAHLRIQSCGEFLGFSKLCVASWNNIKELHIEDCNSIAEIPTELGDISSLTRISIISCRGLQEFPSLHNAHGPSFVTLKYNGKLKVMGLLDCPLESLELVSQESLQWLPEFGDHAARSLRHFTINHSGHLQQCLPAALVNASSLQTLEIDGLRTLEELGNINVSSLIEFEVGYCHSLVQLPSTLGHASLLQTLNLKYCSRLTKLESINVSSLTKLGIVGCTGLTRICPPNMFEGALSLQKVQVGKNCTSGFLMELPINIAMVWPNLQYLSLFEPGVMVVEIPEQIVNLHFLEELKLTECTQLRWLPEKIGDLHTLKKLRLKNCTGIEKLPDTIGNLSSVETLSLIGCTRLWELPRSLQGRQNSFNLVIDPSQSKKIGLTCGLANVKVLERNESFSEYGF